MTFFRKKFPFSRPKILMTFFSHRPGFSDFYSLFSDSPYLYCVNFVYHPFFTTKNTFKKEFLDDTYFFTLFELSPPFTQHYFSKYWGDQCMGRPHLKFWGDRPPSPPRSPPLTAPRTLLWSCTRENWPRDQHPTHHHLVFFF